MKVVILKGENISQIHNDDGTRLVVVDQKLGWHWVAGVWLCSFMGQITVVERSTDSFGFRSEVALMAPKLHAGYSHHGVLGLGGLNLNLNLLSGRVTFGAASVGQAHDGTNVAWTTLSVHAMQRMTGQPVCDALWPFSSPICTWRALLARTAGMPVRKGESFVRGVLLAIASMVFLDCG